MTMTIMYNTVILVLIDTWWNVNNNAYFIMTVQNIGFNRYMVECEYKCPSGVWTIGYGFNRYMVECEYYIDFVLSDL